MEGEKGMNDSGGRGRWPSGGGGGEAGARGGGMADDDDGPSGDREREWREGEKGWADGMSGERERERTGGGDSGGKK